MNEYEVAIADKIPFTGDPERKALVLREIRPAPTISIEQPKIRPQIVSRPGKPVRWNNE